MGIRHPFYGHTDSWPGDALNRMPRQWADRVLIGLLGGSVANEAKPFLQDALNRWFAAKGLPRRPVVIDLSVNGFKQPQQTLVVANTLALGGGFDLIINLDGVNEILIWQGGFTFFPYKWNQQINLIGREVLQAGRIAVLRREQARRAAAGESSPLRWSALFGLANRYRQERIAAQIIRRNHELTAGAASYNLEKYGPRIWLEREGNLLPEAARVWYRGSVTLNRLAELAGADYYHFLQPNQYLPRSKPLSPEELENAYKLEGFFGSFIPEAYPLLTGWGRALPEQGINYFDLTGIFADHPETLYRDECCHLNDRGNELLAAAIVARLEPALLRRGGARLYRPATPLAAVRPPREPAARRDAEFQVSLAAAGKQLRYVRENCVPEELAPRFFLHLTPRDLADLPPPGREYGFANRDFTITEADGRFEQDQCVLLIPLPDYPIAEIRTGQANLWSTSLYPPADPGPLRAEYAALSLEEPAARDYFDLYIADNRLLYLRETCAAADTAADFFLHIIPEELTGLPAERRDAGFVHWDFAFARQGGPFDGKCLAAVPLPDYPLAAIRTGQHIPGQGDLWSVELIAAPDLEQLRADYAALADTAPAARDYFALYWRDNQLLYLRETCAAADTAADFFLHIVPEDLAALPAARRAAGFAYSGFSFAGQGGLFDGKCLAAVSLPDYPIKAMRTGQYVPGQGDLWSVELRAAP